MLSIGENVPRQRQNVPFFGGDVYDTVRAFMKSTQQTPSDVHSCRIGVDPDHLGLTVALRGTAESETGGKCTETFMNWTLLYFFSLLVTVVMTERVSSIQTWRRRSRERRRLGETIGDSGMNCAGKRRKGNIE